MHGLCILPQEGVSWADREGALLLCGEAVFLSGDGTFRKENLSKEIILPPPLLSYVKMAAEGAARERRRAAIAALALLLADAGLSCPAVTVGEYGKPDFSEGLHFSLSHAGGAAAAVLATCPVGLDLEDGAHPILPGARARLLTLFSEEEQAAAAAAKDPDRALLSLWVGREAFCKWDGRGLSVLRRTEAAILPPTLRAEVTLLGREYLLAVVSGR